MKSSFSRPRGAAANILWSAASRGIQAAAGFAAAVAVARHLPLDELGEYLFALATAGAVLSVSYCGVQQYLVRETGRGRDGDGALLGAGLVVRLGIILLAGLGLAGYAALSPAGQRAWLTSLAVAFAAESFRSMGLLAGAVFQAHERMRPECLLAGFQALLWAGALAAAIVAGAGAAGMLAAGALALAGHCAASWAVAWLRFERPRPLAGIAHVWPMLRTSAVIGFSVILVQNLFRANVLVLERFGTPLDVAFFQTPHDLALRLQVVFQAVMLAAFPALARLFAGVAAQEREQAVHLALSLGRLVSVAAGGLTLVLFFFAGPVMGALYGDKLLPAAPCLKIVALATLPLALGMLWSQTLIARGGQVLALWVNAAALAVNVALSLALVPAYGAVGAAVAAVLAYTAGWLGALVAARGAFGGGILRGANAPVLAALACALAVGAVIPGNVGGAAGLAVYALLATMLRGAGPDDVLVLMRCARPGAHGRAVAPECSGAAGTDRT